MPSPDKVYFDIHPTFLILSIIMLFLVPLQWTFAWLIAIIVHEASHLLMLHLMGIDILEIRFSNLGATIITESMHPVKEFFCTLAGPMGALCLLLLQYNFPEVSICALLQSIYNLLPLYPLDGGRILYTGTTSLFGQRIGAKITVFTSYLTLIMLALISLWLQFKYQGGIFSGILTIILFLRNRKYIFTLQTQRSNSTM